MGGLSHGIVDPPSVCPSLGVGAVLALRPPVRATLLKKALHSPAVYAFLDALRESGELAAPGDGAAGKARQES